jgi:hypothetical protein
MKRNRRLLLKTAKRIEEIPKSYNQDTWCELDDEAPCGTVACLAGEIIICSERKTQDGIDKLHRTSSVGVAARNLAGLNFWEGHALFYSPSSWPESFSDRYFRAKSQRGRANAAADLLRYLADGGRVA